MFRNDPRDEKSSWPVRCAECWPGAVILVLACAAGALLVWLHWQRELWSDRAAELGGPAQFRPLDPQMARRLLALAAGSWRPALGLFLLAAGGLLGRVVSAGRQVRRISVAAAWTLVALIGVYWAGNRLLVATIRAAQSGHHLNAYGLWLQGFAFLENALLPIAGLVAAIGAATALSRLLTRLARLALRAWRARLIWLVGPACQALLAQPAWLIRRAWLARLIWPVFLACLVVKGH